MIRRPCRETRSRMNRFSPSSQKRWRVQVRQEAAPRLVVRVGNLVADHRPLPGDFAYFGHCSDSQEPSKGPRLYRLTRFRSKSGERRRPAPARAMCDRSGPRRASRPQPAIGAASQAPPAVAASPQCGSSSWAQAPSEGWSVGGSPSMARTSCSSRAASTGGAIAERGLAIEAADGTVRVKCARRRGPQRGRLHRARRAPPRREVAGHGSRAGPIARPRRITISRSCACRTALRTSPKRCAGLRASTASA